MENNKESIPVAYRDPLVVQELPIEEWEKLLLATAELEKFEGQTLSHKLVQDFLTSGPQVEGAFNFALSVIFQLGNETGRELLEQAADSMGINLGSSDKEADNSFAVRVWLQGLVETKYLDIINRAIAGLEYSQKKINNIVEFAGETSFFVENIDSSQINNLVSIWCGQHGKSEIISIDPYQLKGLWYCNIVRGNPVKHVSEVKNHSLASLKYHPAVCDHIRIEPETGSISISCKTQKLVPVYREVFGEVLTQNRHFFSSERVCSLEPLRIKGMKVFDDHRPETLRRVQVRELKWQGNDGETLLVKGTDCFKVLRDLDVDLKVGELSDAKLALTFFDASRPVLVFIKVPFRIIVSEPKYETIIFQYLRDIGLRGRFDSDHAVANFWNLAPWVYSEYIWKQKIGKSFYTIKNAGLFENVDLDIVRHPDHDSNVGNLAVTKIDNNTFVGYGINANTGMRTLTPTDRTGYKLSLDKLSALLKTTLAITANVTPINNAILNLGLYNLYESIRVQVYFATSTPEGNDEALMKQYANGNHFVLIIPSDCYYQSVHPIASVDIFNLCFDSLIGDIVRTIGLQNEVPPSIWARERLILDTASSQIFYKGIPIDGVNFQERDFKFALIVAKENGGVVSKVKANELLSPTYDDGSAKRAKNGFMNKVNKTLAKAGLEGCKDSDEIFKSVGGGYKLNCSVLIL